MMNYRKWRPTRYLVIGVICFILPFFMLLVGCGQKRPTTVVVHGLEVVNGQKVDAWIEDLEQNPPRRDPLQPYGFRDQSSWTGWNKILFGSAIGGQTADAATTIDALDSGRCREANPLFGESPSDGKIIALRLAVLGAIWWVTEYWVDGSPEQQENRNWIYGTLAVAGAGAAVWNSSQGCH